MLIRVAAALVVCSVGWAYKTLIQPPPAKICGSPLGPPVTSPRIQLKDGRHIAYREAGVSKEKAKYKIIVTHGFADSKDFDLTASQELIDELGIYILYFDRAGYGESDPNPKRTVRSDTMDVEELADQLQLGSKFYLVGVSLGCYIAYGSMHYIPHRLAGVSLVAPFINYWFPSFPANLSKKVLRERLPQDYRVFWIAHHVPSLLYFWMTQKWFPTLSSLAGHPEAFNQHDKEIIKKNIERAAATGFQDKARQQGDFESLHRDLMIGFAKWEFDPMNLTNPFKSGEGTVHMWQGVEDKMVPTELQRYIIKKLPWIKYHEIPEAGHLFIHTQEWSEAVLKELASGEQPATI